MYTASWYYIFWVKGPGVYACVAECTCVGLLARVYRCIRVRTDFYASIIYVRGSTTNNQPKRKIYASVLVCTCAYACVRVRGLAYTCVIVRTDVFTLVNKCTSAYWSVRVRNSVYL